MQVSTETSFAFPDTNLMMVYEIRPIPIACPMEPEIGIARSISATGMSWLMSEKSMFLRPESMITPT